MALAENVLGEGETLIAELPVELKRQFGTIQIGRIIVSNQRLCFLYRSEGSWVRFADYELSTEPFAQYHDNELHAVFIPVPDGPAVSDVESDFISKVEAVFGASHFMDILSQESRPPEVNPDTCDCELISSNKVLIEDKNSELEATFNEQEFRLVSCKDCYTVYGRYSRGKKVSLNKLFSADWLLNGNVSIESIVELGEDGSFAIHNEPNGSERIRDAVLTLSLIGGRSDDVVSTFKHEHQHALCYIQGDEMVGYLSWETHDRGPLLSQLYVRGEYRSKGVATAIISGWYQTFCETNHYFADELTPGGRSVFETIGHLEKGSPVCREVYSFVPLAFG